MAKKSKKSKNKNIPKIRFVFKSSESEEFWYQVGPSMCDNNYYIKGFLDKGTFYIEYTHSGWSTTLLDAVKFTPMDGQIYDIWLENKKIIVDSRGPNNYDINLSNAAGEFSGSGIYLSERS